MAFKTYGQLLRWVVGGCIGASLDDWWATRIGTITDKFFVGTHRNRTPFNTEWLNLVIAVTGFPCVVSAIIWDCKFMSIACTANFIIDLATGLISLPPE